MGLMVAGSSFLTVALPLPVPQSPRLCGVSAAIPGAKALGQKQHIVLSAVDNFGIILL